MKVNNKNKINQKKMEALFFKNLQKVGYRYVTNTKINLKNKMIVKAFQRHYLPNNITGKINQKTFKISHFLTG